MAAIEIAAEHRPGVGAGEQLTFLVRDVVTPVTDAEVDPSVRTQLQPVHVVSTKGDSYPEPIRHCFFHVGLAIAVRIPQLPQLGNAGVEHVPVVDEYARSGAVLNGIEALCKDCRMIGHSVTVGVLDQPQSVVLLGVVADLVPEVLAKHRDTVVDGLQREIIEQPAHVTAIILDSLLLTKGLADVDLAPVVDAEHDRVGHHRFGREELHLDAVRHLKAADGLLAVLRRRSDRRVVFLRPAHHSRQSQPDQSRGRTRTY